MSDFEFERNGITLTIANRTKKKLPVLSVRFDGDATEYVIALFKTNEDANACRSIRGISERGRRIMVYGIFSGEYSDWNCHGYFETQKDADAYCKEMNNKSGYFEYYIKALYNLAEGKDKECKKAYYYNNRTKEWGRDPSSDDDILVSDDARVYRDKGAELVIVFAKDDDAHKVPKIAQDAIAKYWAEREGL